jgi:RND family efflux transporter MFP subunit
VKSLALLLPFILLLAACGEKLPPPEAPRETVKLVKALKVGAGDTALAQRYSGEVRARHETTLGFRVGGKLVERLVDAGARIAPGQPLARLDPADAQLTALQAEANRRLAEAELKRTEELRQKNFVSQAALDAKDTAAQAAVAQAQLAQNQARYTTLQADAAGVVAAVLAEPGQVVAAGQGVFRVARDGEREVAVAIPESRMAGLKVGDGATVTLWADGNGKTYRGRLRELAPAADPATRTFAARVSILDADAEESRRAAPSDSSPPGGFIALGMTASVAFVRDAGAKIVVPLAAILQQGDKPAVWVIGTDNALSQRPVEVERYSDAGAVLKDGGGLTPGETIVAAGAFKLVAGEKVRIAAEPGQ